MNRDVVDLSGLCGRLLWAVFLSAANSGRCLCARILYPARVIARGCRSWWNKKVFKSELAAQTRASSPERSRGRSLNCGLNAGFLLASGDPGSDELAHLFDQYCDWAWHLNPTVFHFLVRCAVTLLVSLFFLWLAFRRGNRSPLLQALIFLNAVILGIVIPVEHLSIPNRLIKAWLVTLCLFSCATLWAVVPTFLSGELGTQRRLRRYALGVVLFLLIGSLLRALPPWTP
jgi:hypothetical protein